MKLLKDYPLKKWMAAADACDMCGGKNYVKVTSVDSSGCFGIVEVKREHNEGCLDYDHDYIYDGIRGKVRSVFTEDLAGWKYGERKSDHKWAGLESRSNVAICLKCEKFVVGVPLILFPRDGKVELDFCFSCAEELGILDLIHASSRGAKHEEKETVQR